MQLGSNQKNYVTFVDGIYNSKCYVRPYSQTQHADMKIYPLGGTSFLTNSFKSKFTGMGKIEGLLCDHEFSLAMKSDTKLNFQKSYPRLSKRLTLDPLKLDRNTLMWLHAVKIRKSQLIFSANKGKLMQITTGIRAALSNSWVYETFQTLMRSKSLQKEIEATICSSGEKPRIIDIGCGTGEILNSLESVYYEGFDISNTYIETAREMFKSRPDCYFYAKEFKPTETRGKEFDIALLKGLLHHLGDEEVCSLLSDVNKVLAPNALVLAIDPVFLPKQNIISRFLVKYDRGQNVRTATEYQALFENIFTIDIAKVLHQDFIPYDRNFILGRKSETKDNS